MWADKLRAMTNFAQLHKTEREAEVALKRVKGIAADIRANMEVIAKRGETEYYIRKPPCISCEAFKSALAAVLGEGFIITEVWGTHISVSWR